MSKKAGRPKTYNVQYFPHFTESSNELSFLEKKHGAEGYRAYYRLFEILGKTDFHRIVLKTENQKLTFYYFMQVKKEILNDVIEYLLDVDFIDRELWENENTIWVQKFVNKLKPVYYFRKQPLPHKEDDNRIDLHINRYKSELESKVNKKNKDKEEF